MSFDWKTFIKLAEYLIQDNNPDMDEAWIRTSISRSYYGIYGIASELIRSKGIEIPPRDPHKFVREKYTTSSDDTLKKIGNRLGSLWWYRKKADYEKEIDSTQNNSKLLLFEANETIDFIKTVKKTSFKFDTST